MLTGELKKLKENLEGGNNSIDERKLLKELQYLDRELKYLNESVSLSSGVCPACGKPV